MRSNNVRIDYIDIAKAIGIFLVVLGHTLNQHGFICKSIRLFHMPLFFLLAGVVYNSSIYSEFGKLLKKRLKSILFPLVNFTVIYIILNYTILIGFFNINDLYNFLPGGMWFLFILFIVECSFFFIAKYNSFIKLLFLFICLIIAYYINRIIILPHSLNSVFIGLFYYGLGNTIQTYFSKYHLLDRNKYLLLSFLIILPIYSINIFNDSIDLIYNYIPNPFAIFILLSMMGIISIISVSILLLQYKKLSKYLIYIGRNTLIILCTHSIFIYISNKYEPFIDNHLLFIIFQQCFIWILCIFSIEIINRYAYFIIGKTKKCCNNSILNM